MIAEGWSRAATPPHQMKPVQMIPELLLGKASQTCSIRLRHDGEIIWELPGFHLDEMDEVEDLTRQREVWASLLRLLPNDQILKQPCICPELLQLCTKQIPLQRLDVAPPPRLGFWG